MRRLASIAWDPCFSCAKQTHGGKKLSQGFVPRRSDYFLYVLYITFFLLVAISEHYIGVCKYRFFRAHVVIQFAMAVVNKLCYAIWNNIEIAAPHVITIMSTIMQNWV